MSTQSPITATHRGRSRRIVVEPIKVSPRKPESPEPDERAKAPAESVKAPAERAKAPAERAKAPAETKQRP